MNDGTKINHNRPLPRATTFHDRLAGTIFSHTDRAVPPPKINDSHAHHTGYSNEQRIVLSNYRVALQTLIGFMDRAKVKNMVLMCIPTHIAPGTGRVVIHDCHGNEEIPQSGGDAQHSGPLFGEAARQYYLPDEARNTNKLTTKTLKKALEAEQKLVTHVDDNLAAAIKELTPEERERFHPMITTLDLSSRSIRSRIVMLLNDNRGVFDGIGEITVAKEVVSKQTTGYSPDFHAGAPIDDALDMARRIGAVINIHCDIGEAIVYAEDNLSARPPASPALTEKFERMNSLVKTFLKAPATTSARAADLQPLPEGLRRRLERPLPKRAKTNLGEFLKQRIHDSRCTDPARPTPEPHDPLSYRDFDRNEALKSNWIEAAGAYVEEFIKQNEHVQPKPEHFDNIKALFERHRGTKIIWAHCGGLGRFVEPHPNHVGFMSEIMTSCPNVHIDLSWDVVAQHFTPDKNATPESGLAQARLAMLVGLIRKYPTRFLFGSDTLVPKGPGSLLKAFRIYHGYDPADPAVLPGHDPNPHQLSLALMLRSTERHKVFFENHDTVFAASAAGIRDYENRQLDADVASLDEMAQTNRWP